jgi:hypothetical protein
MNHPLEQVQTGRISQSVPGTSIRFRFPGNKPVGNKYKRGVKTPLFNQNTIYANGLFTFADQ